MTTALPTPAQWMAAAPALPGSNTPWGQRYGAEIRAVITHTASQAPRNVQKALGPSELGAACDRQVVGKLISAKATNHVADPWPSIVGTAVHAWLAETFESENRRIGLLRYLTELAVAPTPAHPGHTDLYDDLEAACVDWKGIHTSTPVATPYGWTTMGHLAPGDTVFGANGDPCTVTRTYPVQYRDCYRITFDDGSSLITDDVQELPFVIAGRRPRPVTMSVTEAAGQVWSTRAQPQRQLRLYNGAALDLPPRDLMVHPYVLGCWLGDGSIHGGTVSKPDNELFQHIESCGYRVGAPIGERGMSRTIYGLSGQLRVIGLQWYDLDWPDSHGRLAGVKRIPPEYLRASYEQRLSLLQGLMDTDGTWNRPRKRAVFSTTNKDLAEAVAELIATLGWKAHIAPHQSTGFGLTVTEYYVEFTPAGDNPFRLSRKADLVRREGSLRSSYRIVQSIEPILSVPTRCIDVSSPDHLYLAGEQLLPVHNCLGPSTLSKIKSASGPPRRYQVQLLLYGAGCRALGLPVKRVVLIALPRTAATLDGMYVWDHPCTPADEWLIDEVLRVTEVRKQIAAEILKGTMRLTDVPITPDDSECFYCPLYRPQSAYDNGPGCPGTIGNRAQIQ